jgi:putative DNA primase/helicase
MKRTLQSQGPIAFARLPLDAELRARRIVAALGGTWRGTQGECRCPAHSDTSPSLSVRLGNTAILFHCFAGCATADVMKALQHQRLNDRAPLVMPQAGVKRDMSALAMRLWQASIPVAGTLAEDYLLARGLAPPFPQALRFNPATCLGSGADKRVMPALIAAVENDLGVVAVQRTFLDPADVLRRPVPKPKVSLGPFGAAAIRLAPAADELGLAEGIEDALSATAWAGTPTWALGGVERLALVAVPERVRRLVIFADRGRAAERLFDKAREHLAAAGRDVVNRPPPEGFDDWNDAWRAHLRSAGCHLPFIPASRGGSPLNADRSPEPNATSSIP